MIAITENTIALVTKDINMPSKACKLHYNELECYTICNYPIGRIIDEDIKSTMILEKYLSADNKCGRCLRTLQARGIIK